MPQPPPRSLRGLSRSQSRRTGKPRGGRYSVGAGAPVAGGEGGSGPPSNVAPTVSISSPSAGTTITTLPFGVTMSASDSDGAIATTQLYANGVLVGSDSAAPYIVNLSPADGQVTLVARAIDDDGAPTDSSAVVVTVATGNAAPSVAITSPTSGATITSIPTTVTMSASDSDGTVLKVGLIANGTLIAEDTTAPYNITYSPSNGLTTLVARATDDDGATTDSAAVVVTVNVPANVAPTVSITSPTAGSTLTTMPATATISASDSDGSVTNVELFVDGTLAGSDSTAPYAIPFTASNGLRTLTARATDDDSAQTTSSAVVVTVDYTPPAFATTMALKNESGIATESSWVTLPFGQGFKAGDIPSGFYPRFRLGGTTLDYSWWGRNTHPDGSWRFAGFMLRIPSALSNAATASIDIDAVATPPGSASVGLADLYAADLDVTGVAAPYDGANITGTWTATLSQAEAEAAADITDLTATTGGNGGGNVCKYYRIGLPVKQGGTAHAGLYCYFWVFVMQNAAGGLWDIAVLPGVGEIFWNRSGDTDWTVKVWSSMKLRRAGGTIELAQPEHFESTIPWQRYDSDYAQRTTNPPIANDRYQWGICHLTTTGTLPSGLVTGKIYGYEMTPNLINTPFRFGPYGHHTGGANSVVMSDAGSGTHTINNLIPTFRGNLIFITDSTGEYTYCGLGTRTTAAARGTIIRGDVNYLISTRQIPPLDLTDTASDTTLGKFGYKIGLSDPYTDYAEPSGGMGFSRAGLGPIHETASEFFHGSLSLDKFRNHRLTGLWGCTRNNIGLEWSSKGWIHSSPTTHAGTGGSWYNYRWPNSGAPGFTGPSESAGLPWTKYSQGAVVPLSLRDDHMSASSDTPYLTSGRDEHFFGLIGSMSWRAMGTVWFHGARQFTWRARNWHSLFWYPGSYRHLGWHLRTWTALGNQIPDNHPWKPVWAEVQQENIDFEIESLGVVDPLLVGSGYAPHEMGAYPLPPSATGGMYSHTWFTAFPYFHQMTMMLHWYANHVKPNTTALDAAIDEMFKMVTRWTNVGGGNLIPIWQYGLNHGGATKATYRGSDNPANGDVHYDFVNSGDVWKMDGPNYTLKQAGYGRGGVSWGKLTWNASTDTITWVSMADAMIAGIANGDPLMFTDVAHTWYEVSPPGNSARPPGTDDSVIYYLGNVSGNTFKLYRDSGLTDLVNILPTTYIFVTVGVPSVAVAWPRLNPAITSSSGGVGILRRADVDYAANPLNGAYGAETRGMWIEVSSGTFLVGDTVTVATGGTAVINTIQDHVPCNFNHLPKGLGAKLSDAFYIDTTGYQNMLVPQLLNYFARLGYAVPTKARTDYETWISTWYASSQVFHRRLPRFRTSPNAPW